MAHSEAAALHDQQLESLSQRPNTTVYRATHDSAAKWPAARVEAAMEAIVKTALECDSTMDDFRVRKKCMEDPESLAFQRQHPKFFWTITDRTMMRNEQYRGILGELLRLHARVEAGSVESSAADAQATQIVMDRIQTD